MLSEALSFSAHDGVLAGVGLALLLAFWLARLFFHRPPSPSAPLMLLGLVVVGLFPGMPTVDPTEASATWEFASEITVIVVLFATGLKIDKVGSLRLWSPTIRLLAVAMPVTVAAVALLGWAAAGFTIAAAVVLGAVLSPTDPVLAGDVEVGPPLEGGEHPVRFALTTEAGLNDGLAFPFVHLGILIAMAGPDPSGWLSEWILRDVVYRIAVGALVGAVAGWLLGKVLFEVPSTNTLAESGPGALALAGVLLSYGCAQLLGGYGFIAAFVAGLICRRTERRHEFHRRLHDFSNVIVNALMAVLLILLGSSIPALWPHFTWPVVGVGLALVFVIRPLAGWLSLLGSGLAHRERAIVSLYGVRGIASVFLLAFSVGQVELSGEAELWVAVVVTILVSAFVHGLSARLLVDPVLRPERT